MYYVQCKCGENHDVSDVTFLNVEEDIVGRDVLTYICPVDDNTYQSFVVKCLYNERKRV